MSIKNNKYIVEVDKDAKRLKRIFDDLRVNGECIINSNDSTWHSPMRKYGLIIKKNNLVVDGLIEPMWVHINKQNNKVQQRLIRLKPDVVVEKYEGNGKSFFNFKRRRII